jgi:methyl-accepting chemotaxis protein
MGAKLTITHKILICMVAVWVAYALVGSVTRVALPTVAYREVLATLAGLAVAVGLGMGLARAISSEVRSLAQVTHVISEGDLTQDVAQGSQDEIGDLALAFNGMLRSLREIVTEVKATSEAVNTAALSLSTSAEEMNASTEEIAATVEQIAKGAEQQATLIEQTSQVVKGMAASINQVAARAKAAAEGAAEAGYTAQTGGKSSRDAMDKMKEAFDVIEGAAAAVRSFTEKIEQVGSIVDVITKIAQQTHLLALNATIEAARAGESGRGFAVVAEEVRKLASEAGASADRIARLVKEIQGENARALASMETATKQVTAGRDVLAFTGDALEEIVRVVLEGVRKVEEISSLTQEQTRGAESLVRNIEEIAKVAEDNAASSEQASAATTEQTASMEHMADSAQQLSAMADKLRNLVARFRVAA